MLEGRKKWITIALKLCQVGSRLFVNNTCSLNLYRHSFFFSQSPYLALSLPILKLSFDCLALSLPILKLSFD